MKMVIRNSVVLIEQNIDVVQLSPMIM